MDEIEWNSVSEGSLESLERVVLSGSTARRRHGLHELHEKLSGNNALSITLYYDIETDPLKDPKSHRTSSDQLRSSYSGRTLFTLTAHPVKQHRNVSAPLFEFPPQTPTFNISYRN